MSAIRASQYWSLVYTTVYTIHAGALETITIDGVYGSFTTNSDGNVTHALPLGELILQGSVSRQLFTRTVTKDITNVYVMPDGLIGYWYGNENANITGGWNSYLDESIQTDNKGYFTKLTNHIHIAVKNRWNAIANSSPINIKGYSKIHIIGSNYHCVNMFDSITTWVASQLVTCEYLDTVGIQHTVKDFEPYKVDTLAYFREQFHPELGEGDLYAVWLE